MTKRIKSPAPNRRDLLPSSLPNAHPVKKRMKIKPLTLTWILVVKTFLSLEGDMILTKRPKSDFEL
jgi:hypothetical protein